MPDSIGIEVVPDARGFYEKLAAQILPEADRVAQQLGKRLADGIPDKIAKAVAEGLKAGGTTAGRQGKETGDKFSGEFDRTVKTKILAALKSLPSGDIKLNDAQAVAKIREIQAKLSTVGASVAIGGDGADALLTIKTVHAELEKLSKESPDIRVRVDAGRALAELAALQTEVNKLDGSVANLGKSGTRDLETLGKAGAEAGLQISPIGAAIGAGVVASGPLVAAATAGLIGLGGAAGAAFLAYKGISKEIDNNTAAGRALGDQVASISGQFSSLESVAAKAALPGVTAALGKVRAALPGLSGIVATLSADLGDAASHLTGAFVSGLKTSEPLMASFGTLVDNASKSLENFANSDQFKQFIAYSAQELPKVADLFLQVGIAAKNVAVAVQPLADFAIGGLTTGLKALNSLPGPPKTPSHGSGLVHEAGRQISSVAHSVFGFLNSDPSGGPQGTKSSSSTKSATTAAQVAQAAQQTLSDALQKTAAAYQITGEQAGKYAALAGVTDGAIKNNTITAAALSAKIASVASAYNNASTSGSAYLSALSAFSASAHTAADRAALIGATLKASQGDALSYGSAVTTAYAANRSLISGFTSTASAVADYRSQIAKGGLTTDELTTAQKGLKDALDASELAAINLKTGTIDYTKAGAGPLIQSLQAMQDAATAAASATFQHEVATKGAGKAASDAAAIFKGETYDALVKDAGALGLTKDQAKKLADQYFSIPSSVTTTVKSLGTADVVTALNSIGLQLSYLTHQPFTTTVDANTAAADRKLDATNGILSRIPTDKSVTVHVYGDNQIGAGLPTGIFGARGMMVKAYAGGGVEKHVPQIASTKPGTVRVWAEPETKGESYIPHANDGRRSRAHNIMAQTASILGGTYTPYANGGVTPFKPDLSNGAKTGRPVNVRVYVGNREITDIVRTEVNGATDQIGRSLSYGRAVTP